MSAVAVFMEDALLGLVEDAGQMISDVKSRLVGCGDERKRAPDHAFLFFLLSMPGNLEKCEGSWVATVYRIFMSGLLRSVSNRKRKGGGEGESKVALSLSVFDRC